MIGIVDFKDLHICEGITEEFNIILYDKPNIIYFGLFVDGVCVSMMAVEDLRTHYKFRANYTPEKYRKRGYNSRLLHEIAKVFRDKSIVTEANDWSRPLYEKEGFTIGGQRKCKYWTKFFMRREAQKDGKTED